jgi:hypothetical protein
MSNSNYYLINKFYFFNLLRIYLFSKYFESVTGMPVIAAVFARFVIAVGWGEERTPTLFLIRDDCWGSFLTPTYGIDALHGIMVLVLLLEIEYIASTENSFDSTN